MEGAGQALESDHADLYILVLCTLTDHLNSVGDKDSGLSAKLSLRAGMDVENQVGRINIS